MTPTLMPTMLLKTMLVIPSMLLMMLLILNWFNFPCKIEIEIAKFPPTTKEQKKEHDPKHWYPEIKAALTGGIRGIDERQVWGLKQVGQEESRIVVKIATDPRYGAVPVRGCNTTTNYLDKPHRPVARPTTKLMTPTLIPLMLLILTPWEIAKTRKITWLPTLIPQWWCPRCCLWRSCLPQLSYPRFFS